MLPELKPIQGYPQTIVHDIECMFRQHTLMQWFETRYPQGHHIQSDKALYEYTMAIKNQYLRKAGPLAKVVYDSKIHVIKNALGLHSYTHKVHGNRIVRKNDIRIASVFKDAPEPLLRMLVVHELAHLKVKEHDKSFYQLCCHMEPYYHQLELDGRLFIIYQELKQHESD